MRHASFVMCALLAATGCGGTDGAAAPTTPATVATSEETFEHNNLDGELVAIPRTDSTAWTDGRPDPVNIIDLSFENAGCEGVQAEYDFWLSQIDDDDLDFAERASVYARYALDVGDDQGCSLSR